MTELTACTRPVSIDRAMTGRRCRPPGRLAPLALLLMSAAAAAEAPRLQVPELTPVPLLIDGRIEQDEWRGALVVEVAPGLQLRLKQSQGHVYVAVDTPGTSSQPIDLQLRPANGHFELHASMQVAERRIMPDQEPPAWRWGNHVGWIASEMKRDPERTSEVFAEQLHPADGTEFQIRRDRFPGAAWRVRLTVDAIPGSEQAFVYPAGSRADDPHGWATWQLDPPPLPARTLQIPSAGGISVTADEYPLDADDAPILLLCHRAGWSRGEYHPLVAWFNALGFHVVAIDQRSGGEVNGVGNQTRERALALGLDTDFLAAQADIEAALGWLAEHRPGRRRVLMGSSYSSALALRIAGENRSELDAVVAFAPGEYFPERDYVSAVAAAIRIPTFITSARAEQDNWRRFADLVPAAHLHAFLPQSDGLHGAQALWQSTPSHREYREALQAFLHALH
jgi:hypothetical protein